MAIDETGLVQHLLGALPAALAVYLFGSEAVGEAGPDSDVDLAVLVEGKAEPLELWRIANELADIAGRHVDLADLRAASTVFQHQILSKGRRLWQAGHAGEIYELVILREKMDLDLRRAGIMADIERLGRVHGR